MQNLWHDKKFAECNDALTQRRYSSRLLGVEGYFVHGGGNTSFKSELKNICDEREISYAEESGWNSETIEGARFYPYRTDQLRRFATLDTPSDARMAAELKRGLTDLNGPIPSNGPTFVSSGLPHSMCRSLTLRRPRTSTDRTLRARGAVKAVPAQKALAA